MIMNFANTEFAAIAALDLEPIKVKLMHEESGEGWSLEQATATEFEYRRFLYLMKKFPAEEAAPNFDVDIFWHYHILDTMKYAEDCDAVFGYFLHHFPYIGLRGAEDLEAHRRVGERMRELYEETFGDTDAPAPGMQASGRARQTAFSASPSVTVFSEGTTRTAFSAAAARTAFSASPAGATRSPAPVRTAFSAMQPRTAFSAAATANTAFSARTIGSSPAVISESQRNGAVRAQPSALFRVRPGLPSAQS
jgi:hypothetical protein